MPSFQLRGVFVPLVTPFDSAGEVDPAALRHLVDYLIDTRVHGLFVGGTTGEFPLLSSAERREVAQAIVQQATRRVPVVIHAGAPSTREAIELACHARQIGADAVAVVSPYFYALPDAALVEHYERVCAAVPGFPVLLYNIPQRTGNALVPSLAAEIVKRCPNVVGIKDSSGNLSQTIEYCSLRADFQVAQGADGLIVAGLATGIGAAVSGNANVAPELAVAIFEAWWRGDYTGARAAQARFTSVRHALGDGQDLSLFKQVLARRGIRVGDVRPPLPTATDAALERAAASLEATGLPLAAPSVA